MVFEYTNFQNSNKSLRNGGYMQKIPLKAVLVGVLLLIVAGMAWYFDLMHYFSLTSIQSNLSYLRNSVRECYWCALGVYMAIYGILAALMVPAVGPLTLVGGYLFGAYVGFAAAMGSLLGGIGISFTAMRYASHSWLPVSLHARHEKFVARIKEQGAWYIFILNIVTVVPFLVITTLAALSEISLWKFIGASLLGSAPMILMYVFAGRHLADITSFGQLFSPAFIGVLLLLASLSLVPVIMKRFTHMSVDDV